MLDDDIKTLITILEGSNIDELEVSTFWGRQKIRLRKKSLFNDHNTDIINTTPLQMPLEQNISQTKPSNSETDGIMNPKIDDIIIEQDSDVQVENTIIIKAPLVGTFYKSAKPDTPPFISEGDAIKEGQIICIIEAMKIFNEIESDYSGKILKILVEDATPVEYDQDLLVIAPE